MLEVCQCDFRLTPQGAIYGEGGPVARNQQEATSEYVYVLTMNEEGKIANTCKIWNAHWALAEHGWAQSLQRLSKLLWRDWQC